VVYKIIDGDTIEVLLDGVLETVRYYGVDTPERGTECYRDATERNRRLIGGKVRLLADERDRDSFTRLLRYVFLSDGTSVDATLVAEGFGLAWRDDGQYRDEIIALEAEAQAAGRGCLWQEGESKTSAAPLTSLAEIEQGAPWNSTRNLDFPGSSARTPTAARR
jgi:micrococcal nuclease